MTIQNLYEMNINCIIVGTDALFLICVEWWRRSAQTKRLGRGNGRAVESVERKDSPTLTHRPLGDADTAGVSHITPANGDPLST